MTDKADNDALVRERYLSDRFEWAAPGDQQEDAWLLRFCDNDVRDLIWTGEDAEQEAWAAWNLHAPGYNCYLFRLAALRSTPQAKPLDLPAQDEVDRKDVEGIRLHAGRIFARMKRTPHGSKRSLLTDQYIAKFDEAKFAEGWNAALDRHRAGDDAQNPFRWVDGLSWHKPAHRAVMASVKLGAWMSAAVDDPAVCDAMKTDILEWFSSGEPMEKLAQAMDALREENARLRGALRDASVSLWWAARQMKGNCNGGAVDAVNLAAEDASSVAALTGRQG